MYADRFGSIHVTVGFFFRALAVYLASLYSFIYVCLRAYTPFSLCRAATLTLSYARKILRELDHVWLGFVFADCFGNRLKCIWWYSLHASFSVVWQRMLTAGKEKTQKHGKLYQQQQQQRVRRQKKRERETALMSQ